MRLLERRQRSYCVTHWEAAAEAQPCSESRYLRYHCDQSPCSQPNQSLGHCWLGLSKCLKTAAHCFCLKLSCQRCCSSRRTSFGSSIARAAASGCLPSAPRCHLAFNLPARLSDSDSNEQSALKVLFSAQSNLKELPLARSPHD